MSHAVSTYTNNIKLATMHVSVRAIAINNTGLLKNNNVTVMCIHYDNTGE